MRVSRSRGRVGLTPWEPSSGAWNSCTRDLRSWKYRFTPFFPFLSRRSPAEETSQPRVTTVAESSSRRKPPQALAFFIDRSLGRKKVPDALRAAGVEIRVHDELFPQVRQNVDEAGANRWVVVTRDDRIRYNQLEKQPVSPRGCDSSASRPRRGPVTRRRR